ncbi:MAG: hypothetical protein WCI43_01195, partial [Candidatus Firestonebacteria bacterium]
MPKINFRKVKDGVTVFNDYFEVLHSKKAGGAWASIVFKQGSGKNLLKTPAFSSVRFCKPNPHGGQDAFIFTYKDTNDKHAELKASKEKDGSVRVISEGFYQDEKGKKLSLRFRHTWIYNEWGQVKLSLE